MKNGQFPEIIKLADLNGKNGFLLNGEDPGDQCGYSVSALGDFNKDGYNDLAIGAWLHWTGTGRTYVVYGGSNIGNMNPLPLALLNGTNGLKIDGEGVNQGSGMAVAAVGDVNGDGYMDLITGAGYALDNAGRSYVVFGGTSVGSNGVLPLSSLNGVNGFMLDGEAHGDGSGEWVDSAGDINGDGYADILIGAYGHNAYAGRTYVVFGSDQVGKMNPLKLGLLNGVNGFIVDGEAPGDASGKPVRKAGDINQDGYADFMIGADGHAAAGRGYLIFGNRNIGNSGLIALSGLNGTNGFKMDGCGGEVDGAGNITGNLFSEILVGSCAVFGDKNIGSSGLIDLTNLNGSKGFKLGGAGWWGKAGDVNGDQMDDVVACGADCYVVFGARNLGNSGTVLVSDLNGQNGFKLESEVNSPISSITVVADINGDQIDDLLIGAYSYNSNTGRGYVIFGDVAPVLVNNSLSLSGGEAVVLNSAHLGAYDRNHDNATLVFIPSNITHGQFELINNPDGVLNNFTQQQIWDQQIQFVHDGSEDAPTYNITVRSDGIAWTGPILANINFSNFLKLENNKLVINQGQAIVFSSDNLKATYYDEAESDLIFLISNLTHGRFEFLSAPNQSISVFQQQNITDGVMRFVHDNSSFAPAYRVAVSNGTCTNSPQSAQIDFDSLPILVRNSLTIAPRQTLALTTGNLFTTHNGIADPNLMFIISDVQNGFFDVPDPNNITFSQQQVMNKSIHFSQRGADLPAYRVAVSDGRMTTAPASAIVAWEQKQPGKFPEVVELSQLNGKNGLVFNGEAPAAAGASISKLGDVNADGCEDFIIGDAWGVSNNAGRSYVVFGDSAIGKNGIFNLADLNGVNGFKFDGQGRNDESGVSVSGISDVNCDGYSDIIIGAPQATVNGIGQAGYTAIIFGHPQVGNSGLMIVSQLNGTNGFRVDGEKYDDSSGRSVAGVGDINGDSCDDFLIGANYANGGYPNGAGRSYIVFGASDIGKSGVFSLSTLNGVNGFKLDGETAGDISGVHVSAAHDVNGDGYMDFMIAAPGHDSAMGRSYLLFGGSAVGNNGLISLSSLNGTSGFKIDGESIGDNSGTLGTAGDINSDGYPDLIIGAFTHNNTGRSYVVFGGTVIGQSGWLGLSELNGENGFKVDGESVGDHCGLSVDAAGDINGDGYTDLLIGAEGHNPPYGRSYIVFGGTEIGNSGLISLSSLDGINGFKLDGEANTTDGHAVSAAGDVNCDGVDDFLIGAYAANNGAGKTYLIFGDVPPVIVNNSLSLSNGESIVVSTVDLAAYDRNHDNSSLVFILSDVTHGQFELVSNPNVFLDNFTQQQIWDQQIRFVHDGSSEAPAYNITVRSDGIAWTGPITANITFNNFLALENNQLMINQGQTVVFTSDNLKATHLGDAESDLSFLISNVVHGQFEFLSAPNQSILIFQQQNITDGVVRFVHDNSQSAPNYQVAVSNGTLTTSSQSALIDFDAEPILVRNSLTIRPEQTVVLTSGNLYATHNGIVDLNLLFIITDIQNGFFSITNSSDNQITHQENIIFSQQQVVNRTVLFSQQGAGLSVPAYRVAVNDGRMTTSPSSAAVTLQQGQFPEIIQLADLNGQNGFKIDGENYGYSSGYSVSAVGDINGDGHDDLLIGAPDYLESNAPGCSYVVFGGTSIGSSGLINLSDLNGANGFKLNGEYNGDWSGYSVSAAGDINSDGYDDLIIGAEGYPEGGLKGRSYVVFGGPEDYQGLLSLSMLNGTNGFKLDGETTYDWSGYSVSTAGDINNDGHDDLIIGAWGYPGSEANGKGRSYVVFGGMGVGNNGVFSLSGLIGANGFKLDGENKGDNSGCSVSAAGDINGDGYDDLVIGANGYPEHNYRGCSYVVFGGPEVGSRGVFGLSSLNGTNGFKLDGEYNNDWSSYSVSTSGDINSDGYDDLIIGAEGYPGGDFKGRGYVIYGGSVVGNSGIITLSSLNGVDGFKLDGENNGDWSGSSVNTAGDINGDDYTDLLIGANGYPGGSNKGRSYVVFGGPGVGSSGNILLSSLNGINGFKLDGENNNDNSGCAISPAGDINGDGIEDIIIGAFGYNGNTGRSYVIFGDIPPILVNNSLSLFSNETVCLSTSHLSAYDRNHDTLIFIPTNVTHGRFELISNPGMTLDNFTQQQIWDNQVKFVHDGSSEAPAYNITVRSEGIAWTGPISANITFSNFGLEINQLVINQGQTVILTSANLKANNQGKIDQNLSFLISDLTHGQFEFVTNQNQAILIFQQQNITDGIVQFVHDNTTNAPSYRVSVSNGTLTTPAQSALIDFDASPILLNNSLIINQGQTVALTSAFLSATHPGGDDRILLFNISSVMHGKFSLTASPNNSIFSFYQQNITDQLIQFSHDNSTQAPNYSVSVSDGRITLKPSAANIDFDVSPILEINQLVINQGQTVILTDNNLRATQAGNVGNNLEFIISSIQQGQFSWTTNPDQPVTRFVQQNITDKHVQFIHNNSTVAPSYKVAVSDGRITTLPSDSQVDFDTTPLLVHNQLTIGEGQSVTFTSENLLANHNGVAESNLTFQVTNIQNGGFILLSDPVHQLKLNGDVAFQQQQVTNGQVAFVSQNSAVPAYQVSVTDGRITTNPQSSNITFFWKPILTRNQFLANRGQVTVLTTDNIAATRNGTLAKDLQFVVAGTVQHGRFEQRSNPGNAIISFYQQDILQQIIQFAHDNSTGAPQYSLKVLDNQSGLSSDAQTGKTVVVLNNYFPVNQGENLLINGSILNATGIQPQNDGNIVFTPIVGTMQHGHFALSSAPDYPLTSFQQQQISIHEILFVPDNSPTAPSGYLTVSDSQTNGAQGTMACNIDFDVPPVLKKAYLKTSLGEQIKITDINLKATSPTSVANNLIFEISEISHGYFADNDDWQTPLNNFTQQRITDGNMIFITDQSGQSPQFKVSVWDSRLHCVGCPQQADVVFQGENTSGSSLSDAIKNTVITAAVSGVIGLLFFALRYKHSLSLQRNARPTIDGEEQETYPDILLLPIAREIFSRIKITGCLGYIGKRDYNEYIGAVSMIVAALETKEVIQPNQWNSLPRPRKQRIIDAIAMHTKELVGNNRCCSARTFTSFYRAEATPRMIRDQAETIADAVQETLSNRTEAKGLRSRSSVRLTSATSSLNESQMKTPFLS